LLQCEGPDSRDEATQAVFDQGAKVGELAQQLERLTTKQLN
jgi:hypothetical protein